MDVSGINHFPLITYDKIRYSDTDRQGHVNNAVFSTFLETGRVEVLYNKERPILSDGSSFVIASLKLDFVQEIKWPGQVDIGTGLLKVGTTSIVLYQELYQEEKCVARAETVIVQVSDVTKKSLPLSTNAKEILNDWLINREV